MKALNKDIFREIAKTKSKFISILIIMFLGVFVFVGLKETSPTMVNTTNTYFNKVNMYDLKIKNSFSISSEDVDAVANYRDIQELETYYGISAKEQKLNLNLALQSLPEKIAIPLVIEGQLPKNNNEVVLTESLINKYNIGEEITLSTTNEDIKLINEKYKVVGFVYGVDYPENSTNNEANNSYFAYIKKENFEASKVTGINIIVKNVDRQNYTTENYYADVNKHRDNIITILENRQSVNNEQFKLDNQKTWQENKDLLDKYKEELENAFIRVEIIKNFDISIYNERIAELNSTKETLAKQEEQLKKAKEKIDNTNFPRYIVENIKGNVQYKQFIESSQSLVFIANVFSIFLFAVALLVSLTTLTRMIDENRTNIGTLKSLGYSNVLIAKKYYVYGLISSLIGGVLGIIGAYKVIVPIIYNSYARFLTLKEPNVIVDIKIIILALTIVIICVGLAIYLPLRKILKEKSAYLLRPKSPKNGSRILLEYAPFVWRRLSFLRKVTFRNIFRYKIRMLMTVFGVLGCLALMFIGFGIRYGVSNISYEQFKVINKHNAIVTYNPYITTEEKEQIANAILENKNIESSKEVNIANATIEKNNEVLDNITIVSLADQNIDDYITLKNNNGNITLSDDGVIIDEKLAYLHSLEVGSTFNVIYNEKEYALKVAEINTNYFGHILYMSKTYFEKVFDKEYSNNSYLIKTYNDSEKTEQVLSELEKDKNIVFTHNNVAIQKTLDNFIQGIDIIVVVIVLCSVTLALVVLYNLINVNISERIRELSTIKVLGFYASEVTSYVFREIFYLGLVGVAIGNYVGYVLYRKIILELAAREMMFDSMPNIMVYVISTLITLLIIFLVMIIMHIRLKKVNMVEALKAIE